MNITAKIIQRSLHYSTLRAVTTWELEYPRYIHAEFMTHRMFSRNAASSRAIPVTKMIEQLYESDVGFVHYGKNQPGMQAKEELPAGVILQIKGLWNEARDFAVAVARNMDSYGCHKQLTNRVLEPFTMMKVVMTTTEDANWFWLRDHEDAQPEIAALAAEMQKALDSWDRDVVLMPGDWHVPYVYRVWDMEDHLLRYYVGSTEIDVDTARKVSASCCAQVSYRKSDDSIEKAEKVFDRLINSEPVHASPVEHQATPIDYEVCLPEGVPHDIIWLREQGITAYHMDGSLGSGNFKDFIQFRQLIPNSAKW